jgi:hypothetical protein
MCDLVYTNITTVTFTTIINSVIVATDNHHLQPSFDRAQPPHHTLMTPASTKTTPQAAIAVHSSNNNNEQ